jgi:hypothetical protein
VAQSASSMQVQNLNFNLSRHCTQADVPVQAFDDLLLMKAGGMITYHGHLGKRSHALVTYFEVCHSFITG